MACAAPNWARWLKYTVVTTAEPMAAASCWTALRDPLALPAAPAYHRPGGRRGRRGLVAGVARRIMPIATSVS